MTPQVRLAWVGPRLPSRYVLAKGLDLHSLNRK